ncbi:Zonular occludens toxin (Zot) [compost metagenome]
MITFISGAPGTGKTAALVSMLRELGKDRALYVFGIPELKIPHIAIEDPTKWPDDVPDGSVIVIDEVQNVWRPRGPGQKVPEHVAKLETHRHRGLDFYIISQGPNLVDANVRALIGRHVHLRELGVLGRWWYEWPECADNCRTAWKNAPIKKRYRLPKSNFKDYKSSSLHVKPIRSFPWMLIVCVLALVALVFMCWRVWSTIISKPGAASILGVGSPAASAPVSPGVKAITSGVSGGAVTEEAPKFIDDRIAFLPRISSRPETAPAYDELRKVTVMPRIAAGYVMGKVVRCYTQQGTVAQLSEAECRQWLANPPFDPYAEVKVAQAGVGVVQQVATASEAVPVPSAVIIDAPGRRDPVGAMGSKVSGR